MQLSRKAEGISPSITLSITSKAKEMKAQGEDVIIFGAGEPDFDTPRNIQDAAIRAIKEGYTKYTTVSEIDELKLAVSNKFKRYNNLVYSKSQIMISAGAKQYIFGTYIFRVKICNGRINCSHSYYNCSNFFNRF